MPLERKKVGEVFHFYGKIGVAAIRLTDDGIAIGDTVQIQGPATNLEQTVETLQIEHADVSQCFLCHKTNAWNDISGVGWYKHH